MYPEALRASYISREEKDRMASARRVALMRPSEKSYLIVRVINLKKNEKKNIYEKKFYVHYYNHTWGVVSCFKRN